MTVAPQELPRAYAYRYPTELLAPKASWEREVDVVVVGSGVAGLMVALTAATVGRVVVITKAKLDAGSTSWAQGGIAAAIDLADTPQQHLDDTLVAGAGLCSERAVRVLVEEGPQQLARLISFGANLDLDASGNLALTIEGGHGRARIVHAADATGAEVQRSLQAAVAANPRIEVMEHTFALDLISVGSIEKQNRQVVGVRVASAEDQAANNTGIVRARAIVLASGGLGQLYASTTNPPVATGDGMAMAMRAGAAVADVEFIQFHPTVMWNGPGATGQQLLVSEAVRGEGAVLIDGAGKRVMVGRHPLADLAPRDVVAKNMSIVMAEQGVDFLYLDARHLGEEKLMHHFPNIVAGCRARGIDPLHDPIPVAPGEHFACGGVWTDRNGRTSISGLFAVGETACTGVHGANRLASNSLLEGLVFGQRVGAQLVLGLPARIAVDKAIDNGTGAGIGAVAADQRVIIAAAMSKDAAVRRDDQGLSDVADLIANATYLTDETPTRADWEATNVALLSATLVAGARMRTESRGGHWRTDYPETSDRWIKRIVTTMLPDGTLSHREADLEDTP
jgi:nicotinate-nucleotide pyrophosphorylase (carboxylating)